MQYRSNSRDSTRAEAARIIGEGSKSFALAGRILPPTTRLDAQLVYAWCRHADDAVDESPASERSLALTQLRNELALIYGNEPMANTLWLALREVVNRRRIPVEYFVSLLDGMQMDVDGTRYETFEDLRLYCHRVAGVVGWLMVSVLGVNTPDALRPAAHLGIAMQLTNICRDVVDDWENRRLYLPNAILKRHGAPELHWRLGEPFPRKEYRAVAATVSELLDLADRFYRHGDEGMLALSARSAFAIRTARLVYSAIGTRVRRAECDVLRGRAIVPLREKLLLVAQAGTKTIRELPQRWRTGHADAPIGKIALYPDDLLPW